MIKYYPQAVIYSTPLPIVFSIIHTPGPRPQNIDKTVKCYSFSFSIHILGEKKVTFMQYIINITKTAVRICHILSETYKKLVLQKDLALK